MPIRFHLDESVKDAVALGLRHRGIDVTTARDAGLISAADEKHIEFARGAGRVLVTHDHDFLRLHGQGVPHAGIAYCHQRRRTVGQMVHALVSLTRQRSVDETAGRVEFL